MDREKVIKDIDYWLESRICLPELIPWQAIEKAVAMLKKQEAVVRCKDCKHRGEIGKCVVASIAAEKDYKYPIWMLDNRGEWFCADGEKRDE